MLSITSFYDKLFSSVLLLLLTNKAANIHKKMLEIKHEHFVITQC